jgi:hypothetical protein
MKQGWIAAAALIVLASQGCIDNDEEFTLNPDGSGKVRVVAVGTPLRLEFGNEKKNPEQSLVDAVRDTLGKSQGVDAWKDVEAKLRDDGKMSFQGTAYFKDLSTLKLNVLGMDSDGPRLSAKPDGRGGLVVEFLESEKASRKPADPNAAPAGEEQIKARIREERAKYQQGKAFMEGFFKDLRFKSAVRLPGTVAETGVFKKTAPDRVEFLLDGKEMLKAIDGLMMDDAFMRRRLAKGGELNDGNPFEDDDLMERLFGAKGPARVAVRGPLRPAFDYEAEAGPAREGMEALRARYAAAAPAGPGGRPAAPPAKGGPLKAVRVGGVQLVHFQDRERGINPLNTMSEGLTLGLVAELPGAALSCSEGRLVKAVADSGENLLPEREFDREIHFPRLSEDKTAVVFDVRLKAPGAKARGLKEVSGKLVYTVGGATKEVDLGFAALKPGEKGKALGAAIEKIEDENFGQPTQSLELRLQARPDQIESVAFLDAQGRPLKVHRSGYMGGGDSTVFMFSIEGKFPAAAKVVAKQFTDLKSYEVDFRVGPLDLLGRPLK